MAAEFADPFEQIAAASGLALILRCLEDLLD